MRDFFSFEKRLRQSPVQAAKTAGTGRQSIAFFEPALIFIWVFLLASPVANDPTSVVTLRVRRAQKFVDQLRAALHITSQVQVAVVAYNPLVFSVQPVETHKEDFLLTMELGFLLMLEDDELRAAMAHELGHVWLYTHHPFLQTEQLANEVGERVVDRASFEKLYLKLWAYERASGVPIEELLGPPLAGSDPAGPVVREARP